jgi:type IV secretory pathway VirD2 relaxase
MNTKDIILQEKEAILKKLEKYNSSLVAELRAYDKILSKLKINFREIVEKDNGHGTDEESLFKSDTESKTKPLPAIKKLFNENPEKKFISADIKAKLQELNKRGLLIVRSNNLHSTAHSVLRMLLKKDFITKEFSELEGINHYHKK